MTKMYYLYIKRDKSYQILVLKRIFVDRNNSCDACVDVSVNVNVSVSVSVYSCLLESFQSAVLDFNNVEKTRILSQGLLRFIIK